MVVMNRRGFTIIEVMLFLAVTTLMLFGILSSVGDNLERQNYRESVSELSDYIQGQFSKIYNITSDQDGSIADPCSNAVGATSYRGASSCLYVGRLISFIAPAPGEGSKIKTYPVIASVKNPISEIESNRFGSNLSEHDDALGYTLSDYNIRVWNNADSEYLVEDYDFNWQLTGFRPGTNSPVESYILILRSPIDGSVRTYKILNSSDIYNGGGSPKDLTVGVAGSSPLTSSAADDVTTICMKDSTKDYIPGSQLAVRIAGVATGTGDIEIVTNQILNSKGETQC